MSLKIVSVSLLLVTQSCGKRFDEQPLKKLEEGEKITVAAIRSRVPFQPAVYRFSGDTSLYCTITADESSGSFYRKIFVIDDEGAAIAINLLSSGGLYAGDRLRLSLGGASVIHANGCYTIDSVSKEDHIVKLSSGHRVVPIATTLAQVLTGPDLQSHFVELNGVEFTYNCRNVPLGDAIGRTTKELLLTDCQSNTITVSVSGYANFASKLSPYGHGRIAGMVARYNNAVEIELRNYNDILMTGPPCTSSASTIGTTFTLSAPVAALNENFNTVADQADLSAPGWVNYCEAGKTKWKGNVKAGIYRSAKVTAFGAGQEVSSWLISPPVVYEKGMKLSFKTGAEYFKAGHHDPIKAYVCTDLDGSNMASANWTPLEDLVYVESGDGSYSGPGGLRYSGELSLSELPLLSNYSGTIFVGFRYTGEPGFDTNIYLDDVIVKAN